MIENWEWTSGSHWRQEINSIYLYLAYYPGINTSNFFLSLSKCVLVRTVSELVTPLGLSVSEHVISRRQGWVYIILLCALVFNDNRETAITGLLCSGCSDVLSSRWNGWWTWLIGVSIHPSFLVVRAPAEAGITCPTCLQGGFRVRI